MHFWIEGHASCSIPPTLNSRILGHKHYRGQPREHTYTISMKSLKRYCRKYNCFKTNCCCGNQLTAKRHKTDLKDGTCKTTVQTASLVMQKISFNHFLIISLQEITVAMS